MKGLKATVCIVDSKAGGFQCSDGGKLSYFLSFDNGKSLLCTSPSEAEDLIKGCHDRVVIAVTLCSYVGPHFTCTKPTGETFDLAPADADNYFCLKPRDRKRLLERCLAGKPIAKLGTQKKTEACAVIKIRG